MAGVSLAAIAVAAQPNIVLCFVDDLGWSDVGYNGNTYHLTPRIDSLAKQSMVFNDAYAYPTCSPSRACLITGQNTPRHGIYRVDAYKPTPESFKKIKDAATGHFYEGSDLTLGDVMKKAGYVCGYIGKWHLGDRPETLPTGRGFDVNVAGCGLGRPPSYFSPYENPYLSDGPDGEYLPERLACEAAGFIRENKDRPFFMVFAPHLVHRPVQAKPEYVQLFSDRTPMQGHWDSEYAAMVYALDVAVGELTDALKSAGVLDNTLIVFMSDNGPNPVCADATPLRGHKASVYEGGIRVPMFACWPGVIAPGTSDVPVTVMDLLPTFMDAASFEMDGLTLDGETLMPLLTRSGSLKRDALYWHHPCYTIPVVFSKEARNDPVYWKPGELFLPEEKDRGDWVRPCSVIRSGDYKLIYEYETGTVELYNLKEDLGETNNLAIAQPELAGQLTKKLKVWLQEMNAEIPSEPNPDYDPAFKQIPDGKE